MRYWVPVRFQLVCRSLAVLLGVQNRETGSLVQVIKIAGVATIECWIRYVSARGSVSEYYFPSKPN